MNFKKAMATIGAVGGIALGMGVTSQAGAVVSLGDLTVVKACSTSDLSPAASACRGFYDGNLLNNSGNNTTYQQLALAELGFNWNGLTFLEEDGSTDGDVAGPPKFLGQVDFTNALNGTFYFGIHFGAGKDSPGRGNGPGGKNVDTTAFYKVDGGSGLDFINLVYNSGSTARLYGVVPNVTDPCLVNPTAPGCGGSGNSVPEPGTWALMILGFGGSGAMLRRRRTTFA